jgi:hypothetical protein
MEVPIRTTRQRAAWQLALRTAQRARRSARPRRSLLDEPARRSLLGAAHDSGGSAQRGARRCLLGAAQDSARLGAACPAQRDRRSARPRRIGAACSRGSGAGTDWLRLRRDSDQRLEAMGGPADRLRSPRDRRDAQARRPARHPDHLPDRRLAHRRRRGGAQRGVRRVLWGLRN